MPLSRHRVFDSFRPDEAEAFLAAKHFDLRVGKAPAEGKDRTRINAAYLPAMYLSTLTYGRPVEIAARAERSDYALQVPLVGGFETRAAGIALPVAPGAATIGLQREQVIRSPAGSLRMAVSIAGDTMVRQLSALMGDAVDEPLVFATAMALDNPHCAGIAGLLQWAVDELDRSPSLLQNPLAAVQFEQFLITALLLNQDSNYRRRLEEPQRREICLRSVKRAVDYIDANASEPITLADLVAASGIAGRTLYKHFRLSKGLPPMAYLRSVRLQKAREALLQGDGATSVTEVAGRWGFEHLGRFAAEYRRRYGETPSATLTRRH